MPANNLACMLADTQQSLDFAARLALGELPDHPDVNDTMGWVYYQRGQAGRAIPFFQRVLDLAPENAIVDYHLGLSQTREGLVSEARISLDRALELAPSYEAARMARAELGG